MDASLPTRDIAAHADGPKGVNRGEKVKKFVKRRKILKILLNSINNEGGQFWLLTNERSPFRKHMKAFILAAIVGLTLLAATPAAAQILYVPDFSFENGRDIELGTNDLSTAAPGWVFNAYTTGATTGSAYGTQVINSQVNQFTAGYTGSDAAFLNNDTNNRIDSITSAADLLTSSGGTKATIQADTTYTLTVAIGNDIGTGAYSNPGAVSIELLADDNGTLTPVATHALTAAQADAIADGTFQDFSTYFTTGTTDSDLGDGLKVELISSGAANASTSGDQLQAWFDDVRVTDMPAPEPTTWAMMIGGVAVLFGVLRFRRKAI